MAGSGIEAIAQCRRGDASQCVGIQHGGGRSASSLATQFGANGGRLRRTL